MSAIEAVIYNAACNEIYISIQNAATGTARTDIWDTVFRTDGRAATRDAIWVATSSATRVKFMERYGNG